LCICWLIKEEYIKMDGTHNLKIGYKRFGLRTSLQCAFTLSVFRFSLHVWLQSHPWPQKCESTQNKALQSEQQGSVNIYGKVRLNSLHNNTSPVAEQIFYFDWQCSEKFCLLLLLLITLNIWCPLVNFCTQCLTFKSLHSDQFL